MRRGRGEIRGGRGVTRGRRGEGVRARAASSAVGQGDGAGWGQARRLCRRGDPGACGVWVEGGGKPEWQRPERMRGRVLIVFGKIEAGSSV